MTPKAHTTKTKNQRDYIKFRSLCTAKETIKWNGKQQEKIFANQVQWLISKTCEELIQLNSNLILKWAKGWNKHFPKENTYMVNRYMKRCSKELIREICIKTTINYHLTPLRMAITKRTRDGKFWQEGKEKWTCCVHSLWECKLVQLLWKTIQRFFKKSKRSTQWSSSSISGYTPKGNENRFLKR